ncbi:MAG: PAS domain S-box protein [Promethearchaeota archaeon]|nr:MAG: PAS domain S-box protein [Candidatus Lokiarchaeota archaeon]
MEYNKKEIREKFKDLFEYSLDFIFVHDLKGNFLDANEIVLTALRYETEEIPNISFINLIDEEQTKRAFEILKRILKGEKQEIQSEYKLKTKDGKFVYVETYGIPLKKDGEIYAILGIANNITNRKIAEQKLKESEEELTSLLENSPDFIVTVDRNNIIQYINHIPQKFIKEPVIGRNFYDCLMPENQDMYKFSFKKVFNTGTPLTIDIPGFTEAWYTTRFIPIKRGEDIDSVMLIVTNITDIKEAEKKIRDSEEKYRNMINNLDLGFFKADVNGVFLNYNPALKQILGYSPSESLIDLKASDIWENPEDLKKFFNKLVKEGSIRSFVHRAKKKNGEIIFLQVDSHLIRNEENKIIEIEGTTFDVTEKFILEQKLRESEEKHRTLVETSPNSIILLDNRGIIVDCNRKTEILLDLDKKEIIGKNFIDLYTIQKEKISSLIEIFERIKKGVIPHPIEFEYLNKKGKKIVVESYTSLVKMENKMLIQVVSQDITNRKKLED